jgi:membrane protease YdiL (CAAX protease family)
MLLQKKHLESPADTLTKKAGSIWRKEQIIEIGVFLFLIVPSMILSYFTIGGQEDVNFTLTAVSIIMRDLSLISLVFFFLWKNRESATLIGWRNNGIGKEIMIGVVLYPPIFYLMGYLDILFRSLGLKAPPPLPSLMVGSGIFEIVLGVVMVTIVAFSEETIFRGYLYRRFTYITEKPVVAVTLSTFVFSIGHGYEGTLGLASVTVMGFILSFIYLWRRSLVAPAVVHFIQDFLGVVLVPLLGGK